MDYEWDKAKNIENIHKHRIDFADVPEMFNQPMLIELDERFDYGEDRWIGIGFLKQIIAVVIWTERPNNITRIISARKANRHEQKDSKNISHTDWEALGNMSDEDIDYSDIPPLTDDFFDKATLRIPANKASNWLELDTDIIAWFKAKNVDYKTAINSVLRSHIKTN